MTSLQNKLLELLIEVDKICRENGIIYYLHAGNALGAVRHRGFIPWDDDVDIIVTRENWEKFYQAFHSKERPNRTLVCLEDYPQHTYLYGRYVDTTTSYAMRWKGFNTGAEGVAVDFCFFEQISDDPTLQRRYRKWMIVYGEFVGRRLLVNPNGDLRLYNLLKFAERLFGKERILKYIRKQLEKYSVKNGPCSIQMGPHPGLSWICQTSYFQGPDEVEIEGHQFYAPKDPKKFVRTVYWDDWMMLPSSDMRKTHKFAESLLVSDGEAEQEAKLWVNPQKYDSCYVKQKKLSVLGAPYNIKRDRADAKIRCHAQLLALREKLKKADDLYEMLKENRYEELYALFKDYFDAQLYEFKQMDITTNVVDIQYAEPYVIRVSQEELYVACMTLILCGEFYKADKIIKMNFGFEGKIPESLNDIRELLDASRKLSIARYDEDDWEKVKFLVERWLPKYPHHVDFVYANLFIILTHASNFEEIGSVLETAEKELTIHSRSVSLMRIVADARLRLGEKKTAIDIYKKILKVSCDGILNLEIKDILSELGEETGDSVSSRSTVNNIGKDRNQNIQDKLFVLLQEVIAICDQENIPYFLSPALTKAAINNHEMYKNIYANQIIMRPCDRKRFIAAIQNKESDERKLDCFETNSDYGTFSIRYCEPSTIIYENGDGNFYRTPSVCVEILFVKPEIRKKWKKIIDMGFIAAIEGASAPTIWGHVRTRKVIASIIGRVAMLILGEHRMKKLVWKLAYKPDQDTQIIKGLIKTYHSSWCVLPEIDFSQKVTAYLNGHKFAVPANYIAYISAMNASQGPKGIDLNDRSKLIVVDSVNSKDFLPGIDKIIKERAYYAAKAGRLYLRGTKYSPYVINSWNRVLFCQARAELIKLYLPIKEKVVNLYRDRKFEELQDVLQDYEEKFIRFAKLKMPIYFDADVFQALWGLLIWKGKGSILEKNLKYIPGRHIEEVRQRDISSHLKKACTKEDIQTILSVLEKDKEHCLYLYMDLLLYELNNPNISVWIEEDDQGIHMIIMQYHKSFQVYADHDFDNVKGLQFLIEQKVPYSISARREIIEALEKYFPQYQSEYGVVLQQHMPSIEKMENILKETSIEIMQADPKDAYEIANLICSDETLAEPYTVLSLSEELKERMETGMGRSFIIRNQDKIVAHAATLAECDDFVISGLLIVKSEFRDTDYFYVLNTYIRWLLAQEGKSIYGMVLEPRLIKAYIRTGSEVVARYGKLTLKEK